MQIKYFSVSVASLGVSLSSESTSIGDILRSPRVPQIIGVAGRHVFACFCKSVLFLISNIIFVIGP